MTIRFQSHAEAIYDAVKSYNRRQVKYGTANCKESLKRLSELIRGLDSIRGANWASEALLRQTEFKMVEGITWSKRKQVGGMFEHAHPVVEIRNYLLANPMTVEETIQYLWDEYVICWITYEENQKLNSLGYGKKRPNGWAQCYAEAGIKPVKL